MSASARVVVIGACVARLDDGARDRARMALLAEQEDDVGEIALARRGDDVGGARPVAAHAHVERPVEPEREAAFGAVELHRGDAEIEHDAVDLREAGGARDRVELREAFFDQRQPAVATARRVRRRAAIACRVAVDADHPAIGGRQDGARVAAGAEGGVDIDAAVTDVEKLDRRAAEHGNVAGRSASDSARAVAARHHSRAPGASRAAAWEPSCGFERAHLLGGLRELASRNRPGSQI